MISEEACRKVFNCSSHGDMIYWVPEKKVYSLISYLINTDDPRKAKVKDVRWDQLLMYLSIWTIFWWQSYIDKKRENKKCPRSS